MRAVSLAVVLVVLAPGLSAQALAPETSPRPVIRDAPAAAVADPAPRVSTSGAIRPMARPEAMAAMLQELTEANRAWALRPMRQGAARAPTSDDLAANIPGVIETLARVRSLRPVSRPRAIVQQAMAQQQAERAGRLAAIRGLQGEAVGLVAGRGACGIENALRVTSVSGVRLSTPALMDVTTARTLKDWVDNGLKPAVGAMGGGVQEMRVVAHYACRTRNNQSGARLSEHSFGRAIDIAGFTLRNGERIVLLQDWGSGRKGRALRQMHRAACGPFGTVLGPEANRFHRDHFHFDTARHRGGSYCR